MYINCEPLRIVQVGGFLKKQILSTSNRYIFTACYLTCRLSKGYEIKSRSIVVTANSLYYFFLIVVEVPSNL